MSLASEIESRLRSHGLKQHGKNWRGPSPFRADSNSDAFSVTIEGADEGVYNDFVAGEGGNLHQLAARFGIAVERTAVETTKRAYRGLEDYALQHGSTADVFKAARWQEATQDGRPALAFDTPTGTRYRFIDGNKPPYKSPSGYESCWYGLTRAIQHVMKGDAPLVLVNGEASTVVCQAHGIPAACVTSGGERTLSKDLLDELRSTWTGRIVIAFDCDKAGRENAEKLRAQLTDYSTAVIDFGLTDGGDAADWCKLHGEKAWERLLERAKFTTKDAPKADTPKYIRSGALMKQVSAFYRKVQAGDAALTVATGIDHWDKALMGGMWSGLNFLAGPMGSGKSTLASSVVGNWTRRKLRGMIIATEMTPGQWVTRVWAHLAGVRTDEIMLGNYNPAFRDAVAQAEELLGSVDHIWRVEGMPTVAGVRDDILKLVANKEIDFVVVDSSSNMHAEQVSGSIFDQTKAVTNQLAALSTEVQAVVGDSKPIPFVVTHQANANNLLKKANKTATMLDSYGGQSPAQDAVTYTVINYLQWFVSKQLADPDPDYPAGVAALIVDKHRFFMNSSDKPVRVRFEEGMGFYGDRVPPRVNGPVKPHVLPPPPRQYKDDDMPADLYGPTGTDDEGMVAF